MLIELYCRENIRKEAWAPRPEPGTSYHNLQVRKASVKPVCQRRRKMAPDQLEEIERQVKELQEA